jgi:hypothetical protein
VIRAIVLALTIVATRPALAGECSHGGGSSSSGSSSSSSSASDSSSYDSSSSSDSASAAVPACVEVSDVVGHSTCRSFGDGWKLSPHRPAVVIEVGGVARMLRPGFGIEGAAGHLGHTDGDFSYRMIADGDEAKAAAMGAVARLVVPTPYRFYGGVELEAGGIVRDTAYRVETTPITGTAQMPTVATRQDFYVGVGGIGGVRGRIGQTVLAAEVAAGVHSVQGVVDSRLGTCTITDVHWAHAAFVEPRVRADHWLNPWLTIGAYAGGDLLGGGQVLGMTFALHTRAFDRGW